MLHIIFIEFQLIQLIGWLLLLHYFMLI